MFSSRPFQQRSMHGLQPAPAIFCVHQLVEAQCRRTPDRIAVVCDDATLTYRDLHDGVTRLRQRLCKRIPQRPWRAAVLLDRSSHAPIALLGVLTAGGTCVALDPLYPPSRLAWMLRDSAVSIVVTTTAIWDRASRDWPNAGRLQPVFVDRVDIGTELPTPAPPVVATDPAFIVYTSGSMGEPKGVIITHANLSIYLRSLRRALTIDTDDRVLHTASLAFSSSNRQLWLPLSIGAAVVMSPEAARRDPLQLFDLVGRAQVTTLDLVPAFWRRCITVLSRLEPEALASVVAGPLRLVLAASEQLDPAIPTAWRRLGFRTRLMNMFGTTETTGIVATYSIPEDPIAAATVPIGRPLDAVTCAIVDETGREVPDGISGVLQVTGGTVSSGYLHDPNLTARAFSHDAVSGAPCYNTGDICRRRADGVIDHLGRHDAQIKTRGMRVHPAEIERVLQAHAAIAEAVAVGRMHRGDTSIVAFVVPRDACAPLDRAALRRDLCERLPDHMVPAQIVVVDSLPLTPNGKIDRQALMSCDIGDVSRDASDATLAPEPAQRLAAIWAEVLGVARIDPNAGFYELGGNSLLAIEVASRLFDEFGVRVPPSVIAAVPSVARLAASLDPQRSIHS